MKFDDDIMDSMEKLPISLERTYSQILEAIRQGTTREREVTRRALMWIMSSPNLLTPEQWTGLSYWPSRAPIDGMDSLIQLCRGLVTWDRQLMVIKFPHLSVQEYLDTVFDSVDCNTMAAGCCLLMLNPVLPWSRGILTDYANTYWPYHVGHSYSRGRHFAKELLDRLNDFLGPPQMARLALLDWLPIAIEKSIIEVKPEWILYMMSISPVMNISPLMIASYFRFGEELYHQWECDGIELSDEDGLPALLEVACGRGNEAVVQILLRNPSLSAINWGNGPLREAIFGGHGSIAVQLVNSCVHHRNTDYEAVLELVACHCDSTVMRAFMDSGPSVQITEEILIEAAKNLSSDIIIFLLDTRLDAKITERILVTAVEKGLHFFQMLLERDPAIQITEPVLNAVVAEVFDEDYTWLELLLARIEITEAMLISTVRNAYDCHAIVMFLLHRYPVIQITAEFVIAVMDNEYLFERSTIPDTQRDELCMKLLSVVTDSEISERIVVAITKRFGLSEQVMTLILTRLSGNPITEGIVLAVAHHGGRVSMEVLLARNPDINVRELVLVEMLANHN